LPATSPRKSDSAPLCQRLSKIKIDPVVLTVVLNIEAGMMDHDRGGGICGNDESGYGERG